MEIRVWQSFACNNSSSYRLVARFPEAERARATAEELLTFIAEVIPIAQRRRPTTPVTSFPATTAVDALATEHGFDWTDMIVSNIYGDADELSIVTHDATLVVFHPYCLGLGEDLPAYLVARGAEVERASALAPTVSVTFRLPEDAEAVKTELAAIFAQANETERIAHWAIKLPWSLQLQAEGRSADTAFFCTRTRLGFYMPIEPAQIEHLKEYLHNAGIRDATIRLCEYGDLPKFRAMSAATCPHCASALELVDREDHGLETDQLACVACGGMFDLETLT
jgi:hypothetical protein